MMKCIKEVLWNGKRCNVTLCKKCFINSNYDKKCIFYFFLIKILEESIHSKRVKETKIKKRIK